MPRFVFATQTQARKALRALNAAKADVAGGVTLDDAVERHHISSSPTASKSTLARWVRHPAPSIEKTRSGFYLKVAPPSNFAFSVSEEQILVDRIKARCQKEGHLEPQIVMAMAKTLREELMTENDIPQRKRLVNTRFETRWVHEFVARNRDQLSNKVGRPVDHAREAAFNSFTIGQFFAQVSILYEQLDIRRPGQVANLDESGFTPGRDLCGGAKHRVVTPAGVRASLAKPNFKYAHRVTILAAIFADGSHVSPAVVFRGEREPHLSSATQSKRVSDICPPPWCVYWRKDIASMDTQIFRKWVKEFVPKARAKVNQEEWIVLFYDGFRAHMASDVIDVLAKRKIAVMALPSHTSDRLQPLDLTIFGPMKHYSNLALDSLVQKFVSLPGGGLRIGGLYVWECIQEGYEKAMTTSNIMSGFRRSGLWPLDASVVCENGIRSSRASGGMQSATEFKTDLRRYITDFKRHGLPMPRIEYGFICTREGIELTREDVREELKVVEEQRREKEKERALMEASKYSEQMRLREVKRRRRERIELSKAQDRVQRYGIPLCLPRPLEERRSVARQKGTLRRCQRIMQEARNVVGEGDE